MGPLLGVRRSCAASRGNVLSEVSAQERRSLPKGEPFLTAPSVRARGKPLHQHLLPALCEKSRSEIHLPPREASFQAFPWGRLTAAVSSSSFHGWRNRQCGEQAVHLWSLCDLVAVKVKLVRLVFSLGIEGDLQCLCLKCFSAVLGNQTDCFKSRQSSFRAGIIIIPMH